MQQYNNCIFDSYAWEAKEDGSIRLVNTILSDSAYTLYAEDGWIILDDDDGHTLYRMKPEE